MNEPEKTNKTNGDLLMDAMEFIDDDLILESAVPKKAKAPDPVWMKYTAAACFCIVCFAAIMTLLPASRTEPDIPPTPTEITPVTESSVPDETETQKPEKPEKTDAPDTSDTDSPTEATETEEPSVTVSPDTEKTEPTTPDTTASPKDTTPTDTVEKDKPETPDTKEDQPKQTDTSEVPDTTDAPDTAEAPDTTGPADTDVPGILPEPEQLYDPSIPAEEYISEDAIGYRVPEGMFYYPALLYTNGGDYAYMPELRCAKCAAPGFHDYGWLYGYFFPELSYEEARQTKDLPLENDPYCSLPNIRSFVIQNGITREMLEKAQNDCHYIAWNDLDLDAIYGDDDAMKKWIASDGFEWDTEYDRRSFLKEYKINLARTLCALPEYKEQRDNYFYRKKTLPDIESLANSIRRDTDMTDEAKMRLGINYFHEYLYASKYYDIADTFTIAEMIRDTGITREHAELLYKIMYGGKEGRVKIDFDALYSDIDYYADLSGEYEYVWQADALLIK